jgi:hypothetical protein
VLEFAEGMELEASIEAVVTARPRLVYSDPLTGEEIYECGGQKRYSLRIVGGSVLSREARRGL